MYGPEYWGVLENEIRIAAQRRLVRTLQWKEAQLEQELQQLRLQQANGGSATAGRAASTAQQGDSEASRGHAADGEKASYRCSIS